MTLEEKLKERDKQLEKDIKAGKKRLVILKIKTRVQAEAPNNKFIK